MGDKRNDGGPAFPNNLQESRKGLTKHDVFAIVYAYVKGPLRDYGPLSLSQDAIRFADAMLEERDK